MSKDEIVDYLFVNRDEIIGNNIEFVKEFADGNFFTFRELIRDLLICEISLTFSLNYEDACCIIEDIQTNIDHPLRFYFKKEMYLWE